ncbi:hypothetical protein [Candidatus Villigracilis saccharophilus]|uniref:hypothetical protein n=1 Tax=Candidatus Villigracilis saccharophilus TaxID=3140684 RepID=UPI003135C407|nr:hypothetical protein [Anaerolineales bacterium]
MKIAIYCPLGPLDQFGYQYNHKVTVESFCSLADRVYLVSTSRSAYGFAGLSALSDKISLLSDERTWFQVGDQGQEVFDAWKPCGPNANIAVAQARAEGLDCIITMHVNQYVPAQAVSEIKVDCADMLEEARPYTWLYRRYQLADRLFHTDVRLPWILNLRLPPSFEFDIDSIKDENTGAQLPMEFGDFRSRNRSAIVDAGMELEIDDLVNVRKFTRNYIELRPYMTETYNWEEYQSYYAEKFKAKSLSNDSLDELGKRLFQNTRESFVSRVVLREYMRSRSIIERLRKFWRKSFKGR